MRWDSLFADLEAQLDESAAAALASEVAERTRAEWAAIRLRDRIAAHADRELTWFLADGEVITGGVADLGADWVLLRAGTRETLVPLASVSSVSGLPSSAVGQTGLARRLALPVVLRGLARDRSPVRLYLAGGGVVTGTLDRVGADHVDVAVHPGDELRRTASVIEVRTVALAALIRIGPV